MSLSASFDEFNLDLELRYAGDMLPMVEHRPTADEIVDHEDGAQRLAAYLLRRYASRMTASMRDGNPVIRLHFDH
jgi:NCS2 family nucleobase:cation symporter-2